METLSFGGSIDIEAAAAQATLERLDKLIETTEKGFATLAAKGGDSLTDLERHAKKSVDPIEKAFQDLGVKSQKSLEDSARHAQASFETIRKSGVASAEDIVRAQAAVDRANLRLQDGLRNTAKVSESSFKTFVANLDSAGAKMTNAGQVLTAGLTVPIIGLAAAALKMSTDFNASMANVASLIPGSTDRVKELKTAVQDMAVATGKSTQDLAGGLYQVLSAFGNTADTVKILEINAKAAAAGVAQTTDAINLTSAVTKGYGDTSAEAVLKASDLALLTVRLGQTTFPELAGAIGRVTPLTAALKVSQEELFAVMATGTGVTGGAAEVSTQLRGIMQSLMSPTKDMSALFKSLGVESGAAMIKQFGFQKSLELIVGAAEKTKQPLQTFLQSIEGQTLALALTGGQADAFTEKLAAMQNAAGATDAAFKEQTEGVNKAGFAWAQFRQKIETTLQKLGDAIAPALIKAAEALEPLINKIIQAADTFTKLPESAQQTIIGVLAVVAAIGPALVIFGQLASAVSSIAGLFSLFGGGAAVAAEGATVVGGAATAAGVSISAIALPIAAAIAAIVALFAAYMTNFEGFGDSVDALFSEIANIVKAFIAVIQDNATVIGKIWQAIKDIVSAAASGIVLQLGGAIDIITAILRAFQGNWQGAWEKLKEGTVKIFEGMNKLPIAIFEGLKAVLIGIAHAIVDGIVGAWNALPGLLAALWEKVKAVTVAAWNALIAFHTEYVPSKLAVLLDWFKALPGRIVEFISSLPERIGYVFGLLVGTGTGLISDFVGKVIDFFKALPGQIVDFLSTLPEKVGAVIGFMVAKGVDLISGFVRSAIDFFKALPGKVVEILVELPGKVVSIFTALWNGVTALFQKALDAIVKLAISLYNGAKEWISKLPTLIYEAGVGILNELLALPGKVVGAAISFGKSIVTGFRTGIEKHSPTAMENDIADAGQSVEKLLEGFGGTSKEKAKKHGKAIVDGFSEGLTGFTSAFNYITSQLATAPDKLFAEVVPKVKDHAQKTKQAWQIVVDAINGFLGQQANAGKVTEADLKAMETTTRNSLVAASFAWKEHETAVEQAATAMRLGYKSTIQEVNAYLKSIGVQGKTSAEAFMKYGADFRITLDMNSQAFKKAGEAAVSQTEIMEKAAAVYNRTHPPVIALTAAEIELAAALHSVKLAADPIPVSFAALEASMALGADSSIIQSTKITEAFDKLSESIKSKNVPAIISSMESMHSTFVEVGLANGLTLEEIEKQWAIFVEKIAKEAAPALQGAIRNIGGELNSLNVTVGKELERLAGLTSKAFADMIQSILKVTGNLKPAVVKQFTDTTEGILLIIGALPGKIGDKLRGGVDKVMEWVNRVDQIMRGLHKIFDGIPDGIGSAIEKLKGIFGGGTSSINASQASVGAQAQSTAAQVAGAGGTIASATSSTAASVAASSSKMVSALSAIGAAAGMVGGAIGGRVGGAIAGAGSGLMMGAQIGALFGPAGIGIGAAIGAVGGAIMGIFGGGKSAAQKEQERLQQEQQRLQVAKMKQDLEKGAQEVIQAALQTFEKAMSFLEGLADYSRIPKAAIQAFFHDLSRVIDYFSEMTKEFSGAWLAEAKLFAEALAPMIDLVAGALEIFIRFPDFVEIPKTSIEAFGRNLDQLVEMLGAIAEKTPNAIQKQIRKFSERMQPAADLVGTLSDNLNKVVNIREISPDSIARFSVSLDRVIEAIGAVEDKFDAGFMRAVEKFATRAGAAVSLFGLGAEQLSKIADAHIPDAAKIEQVSKAIQAAVMAIQERLNEIDALLLRDAGNKTDAAASIIGLIAAIIDPFVKLDGLTDIPEQKLMMLADAMRKAIMLFTAALADMATEMLEATGSKASPVKTILEALGAVSSAAKAIADFPEFDFTKIVGAVEAARMAVNAFVERMKDLDGAAVAAASSTAQGVKGVIEVLAQVQALLSEMANGNSASIQQLTDLAGAFKLIVEKVNQVAREVGTETLASVLDFSRVMMQIVNILSEMLLFFAKLADFTGIPTEALETLSSSLDNVLEHLRSMVLRATEARTLASQFEGEMSRAADAMVRAVSSFSRLEDAVDESRRESGVGDAGAGAGEGVASRASRETVSRVIHSIAAQSAPQIQSPNAAQVRQTVYATFNVTSEDLRDIADVRDTLADLAGEAIR